VTPIERLMSKVRVDGIFGCWVWTAAKSGSGYGQIFYRGRQQNAHRVAYQLLVGAITPGLELDHLCRNRPCVNPAHLEPVTSSENKRRSPLTGRGRHANRPGGNNGNGLRTACRQGHAFTPANTYQRADGRRCRTCNRDSAARTQKVRLDRLIAVGVAVPA
jgi:hypothetical protein